MKEMHSVYRNWWEGYMLTSPESQWENIWTLAFLDPYVP